MRAQKREGFGWKRWSRQWLYGELGLFNGYRESPTGTIGPTNLDRKRAGKPHPLLHARSRLFLVGSDEAR